MAPNPIDDEELYQSVVLGGLASPGTVTLSGHDRKVVWDVQGGTAQSGAVTRLKNVPPIEFTATFYLIRDESQGIDDFAAWPAFLALINTTIGGKAPKALDIYHPDLASNDIKSVVKGTVGGTVHDKRGGQTIAVKFQEYKPPKATKVTPLGSLDKPPDPDAAAKAELAALTDQFRRTNWDGTVITGPLPP